MGSTTHFWKFMGSTVPIESITAKKILWIRAINRVQCQLYIYIRVGPTLIWKQLVLIKVVHFYIKISIELVWKKVFFLLYDFFNFLRSQANWAKRNARTCALSPDSWRSHNLKNSYRRKKEKIKTNLMLIFMHKQTTFINTSCSHFDFEPTLLYMWLKSRICMLWLNIRGKAELRTVSY